ncbi:MAG: SelB C-terminal domain-containing protein, partial [Acidobacteriota bacterium]
LVRREHIVRIATGTYVDREALEALAARVRDWLDTNETLSPGDFKTLSGLTRKNAIAMLEWLDRRGVTRRKGDLRVRA